MSSNLTTPISNLTTPISNPTTPITPDGHSFNTIEKLCPKHNDQLKVFCVTCVKQICRDCAITPEHRNHDYNLVTDLFTLAEHSISSKVRGVTDKVKMVEPTIEIITKREKTIEEQGCSTKRDISQYTQRIIDKLQECETKLHEQVDNTVNTKCKWLHAQRQDIYDTIQQMTDLSNSARISIESDTKVDVLYQQKQLLFDLQQASDRIDRLVLTPIENANIEFINSDVKCDIGAVKSSFMVTNCTLSISPSNRTTPWVAGIPRSLITTISTGSNSNISSIPLCLMKIEIESIKQGKNLNNFDITYDQSEYSITFQPEVPGKHDVHVYICDQEIKGSPIPVLVSYSPNLDNRRNIVIPNLNKPHGCVLIDKTTIAIVEYGSHCITMLDDNGNRIRSIGRRGTRPGQFTQPRGIALSADQNHLLVTDNHRIQQLTFDGEPIMCAGGSNHGLSRNEFYNPTGIAVNPSNGNIYVADTDNNRIKILNSNLEVIMIFGRSSDPNERLKGPYDVRLDNAGDVYVADSLNHCIRKYNSNGRLILYFSNMGVIPGTLNWPTAIAINSYEYLYITEQENSRVSIFTKDGKFIDCYPENFSGPQDIHVDSEGNVYISDTYEDKLYIYYA